MKIFGSTTASLAGASAPRTGGLAWNRGLLGRGESLVASGGAALAMVFVGTLAGSVWWAVHVQGIAQRELRDRQASAAVASLAAGVEGLLNAGELSRARALLSQSAHASGFGVCRVILPNGAVLADVDAARITEKEIPLDWPAGSFAAPSADPGTQGQAVPLEISGRGSAQLEARWSLDVGTAGVPGGWTSDLTLGMGVIGAIGLAGWALAYRRMRTKIRGVGAVGDALRAAAGGENSTAALTVSRTFGAEAVAWNALLADREALQKRVAAEVAGQVVSQATGGRRDSDLAGLCDALWLGLMIVDDKSVVRYVNGAAAVLLGSTRDDLLGKPASSAVRDERAAGAIAAAASGANRQRLSVEVESGGESGRGVIRFSVRAIRREQTGAAMVLVEDVTQQRVADESRNSFVAQVTHELRTPLTNIRLYLETLVDAGDTDPATRAKCINVIGQESRRLERVVADMLSVAEIEAGSLKLNTGEVRLDALFEELHNDFRAQAQDREIALQFELPPKFPVVVGDRDKIMLALHNIIGNALKYTPVGGKVVVHVETDASGVSVSVIDNGIGIKPEECELVFDKFYRAKDKRIAGITGSGLGLALARQVVRLHGGDIQVRSQIDKGSTFTMVLPMGKAA